jgi:CubicO group peptidase (beta-lactamase class C family)
MNVEAAAAYAARHGLEALLVTRDGETLFESYGEGFDASKPHALYSGTKSFWGPLAVAAQADGLLDIDERVGATFPDWDAGEKARVTLRELLALTSGIGFGGLGNAVPIYARALAVELKNEPGSTFTYGGIPLQVFGAVLAEKLKGRGLTPHDFLAERILRPIGLTIDRWRALADGTKPLPTGTFVSAAEWAKFGRFVAGGGTWGTDALVPAGALATCFAGSAANPRYGLGWWLAEPADPQGVVYASGSGGQAMYVVREQRCVVVKFGRGASYKHDAFLKRLLG